MGGLGFFGGGGGFCFILGFFAQDFTLFYKGIKNSKDCIEDIWKIPFLINTLNPFSQPQLDIL